MKVSILVQCAAPDSTYIKVTPWEAKLKKQHADDLEFAVDPASNVDSVFIELKSVGADWPLAGDPPPYKLGKGASGKKGLKDNPALKETYPYNIRAYCTDATNKVRRILIDPDIFVD